MLALARVAAEFFRLTEGEPVGRAVAVRHRGHPQHDRVDALIWNALVAQRAHHASFHVAGVPGPVPRPHALGVVAGRAGAARFRRHGNSPSLGRLPMWGLDAARRERGASATEGRGGGGGSPGLQAPSPKAGDTAGAGEALAPQWRGALQGPRVSRPGGRQRRGNRPDETARRRCRQGHQVALDSAAAILNTVTKFKMRRDDGQEAAAWRVEGRGGTQAGPSNQIRASAGRGGGAGAPHRRGQIER